MTLRDTRSSSQHRASTRIDVFSIFPDVVDAFCSAALLGRARETGIVDLRLHDIRDGTDDAHRSTDDMPFGGGAGMVLSPGPIFRTVEAVEAREGLPRPFFLLGPGGRRFDQSVAEDLAASVPGFSLLCGRYEGVDQRVRDFLVDDELSVGDVILAGGEAAACVVIEAVTRLLPGTMGNSSSREEESFADGLLEYPHYTRPADFRGHRVPEVLRSGDHGRIRDWRRLQALRRTLALRPDLIERRGGLRTDEQDLLASAPQMEQSGDHGYDGTSSLP